MRPAPKLIIAAASLGAWPHLVAADPEVREPWIFVEGGMVIGKSTGSLSEAPTSYGPALDIGARIAPNLTAVIAYRDLLQYTLHLAPTGFNDAPLTFHYADVLAGIRYTYPLRPNFLVFGEAKVAFGSTTISSTDFAGGDDQSEFVLGAGARIGAIGQFDRSDLGVGFGAGVALSFTYMAGGQNGCGAIDRPCINSWRTLDLFARVTY